MKEIKSLKGLKGLRSERHRFKSNPNCALKRGKKESVYKSKPQNVILSCKMKDPG